MKLWGNGKLMRQVDNDYNAPYKSDRRLRWKSCQKSPRKYGENKNNATKKTQCRIQSQNSAGSSERLEDDQRNSRRIGGTPNLSDSMEETTAR